MALLLRLRRALVPVLVGVVLLGTAAVLGHRSVPAAVLDSPTDAAASRPVREILPEAGIARAMIGDLVIGVSMSGSLVPRRAVTALARTTGSIDRLAVSEGDTVVAGEPIAFLDASDLRLAVRDAEVKLQQAELAFAELTLFDERVPDPRVRAERRGNARLRSGLAAAEVMLERSRAELSGSVVRAPFRGIVSVLHVQVGQPIARGQQVAEVASLDTLLVAARALEADVPKIKAGASAMVQFASMSDTGLPARVLRVRPAVDPESHRGLVTLALLHAPAALRSGGYATASVEVERRRGRLLVPRAAILERDGKSMVFVAPGETRETSVQWRYVHVVASNDRFSEIEPVAGSVAISPGDRVLVSGHANLVHQARVTVVESDAP